MLFLFRQKKIYNSIRKWQLILMITIIGYQNILSHDPT